MVSITVQKMSHLPFYDSFEYLLVCCGSTTIQNILILSARVYRRQILTYKDGPRLKRPCLIDYSIFSAESRAGTNRGRNGGEPEFPTKNK